MLDISVQMICIFGNLCTPNENIGVDFLLVPCCVELCTNLSKHWLLYICTITLLLGFKIAEKWFGDKSDTSTASQWISGSASFFWSGDRGRLRIVFRFSALCGRLVTFFSYTNSCLQLLLLNPYWSFAEMPPPPPEAGWLVGIERYRPLASGFSGGPSCWAFFADMSQSTLEGYMHSLSTF